MGRPAAGPRTRSPLAVPLGNVPVAYFFTCGTLFEPTAKNRSEAQKYAAKLENLPERVSPVGIGQFAGVLDYAV